MENPVPNFLGAYHDLVVICRTEQAAASDIVKARRLQWFGYVARSDPCRITAIVLLQSYDGDHRETGRDSAGRLKLWRYTIEKDIDQHNIGPQTAWRKAQEVESIHDHRNVLFRRGQWRRRAWGTFRGRMSLRFLSSLTVSMNQSGSLTSSQVNEIRCMHQRVIMKL